jgi:hypothetical protein
MMTRAAQQFSKSMPGYSLFAVTGRAAQTVLIAVLTFAGFCSLPASNAQAAGLEGLAGQAAEISASAYEYRADRSANQNPPETAFLFETGIGHTQQGVLGGLLWEEPRAVDRIELTWPKEATPRPKYSGA